MNWINILEISVAAIFGYLLVRFVFDIILRGFAPFISSRPWVVKQVLSELDGLPINNLPRSVIYAFNCGRSGFTFALQKKYPQSRIIGYEKRLYPYIVARVQAVIRMSQIKIIRSRHFHRAYVKDADLIYSHIADLKTIREMGEKFKFECQPGTLILSNGFIMPSLAPFKTLELLNAAEGRFGFLATDRNIFFINSKKTKKENKIFFSKI
jgi:hypothetical protein